MSKKSLDNIEMNQSRQQSGVQTQENLESRIKDNNDHQGSNTLLDQEDYPDFDNKEQAEFRERIKKARHKQERGKAKWVVHINKKENEKLNLYRPEGDNLPTQFSERPITFWDDSKELSFLGPGYPLFFYFIKFCCWLLVVMIFTAGSFDLISDVKGSYCTGTETDYTDCLYSFFTVTSLANKMDDENLMMIQEVLNLISVVACIIFFQFFRYRMRVIEQECDRNQYTEADYAIMVTGAKVFLKDSTEPSKLKNTISDWFQSPEFMNQVPKKFIQFQVAKRNNGDPYIQLLMDNTKLEEEWQKIVDLNNAKQQTTDSSELSEKEKNLITSLSNYRKFTEFLQAKSDINPYDKNKKFHEYFTGKVIVTFEEELHKYWAVQAGSQTSKYFQKSPITCNKQILKIEQAPEPSNVHWINASVGDDERRLKRIYASILIIILLAICFCTIGYLTLLQDYYAEEYSLLLGEDQDDDEEDWIDYATIISMLCYSIAITIICLNVFCNIMIKQAALLCKFDTFTKQILFQARGQAIIKFFNAAGVIVIIEIILPIFHYDCTEDVQSNIFGTSGITLNQFYIFITCIGSSVFYFVFDYMYYIQQFKLWNNVTKFENAPKEEQKQVKLTQMQMDVLFVLPLDCIEYKYSYVMYMMFMTAFFAPLIPMAFFLCLAALIVSYYIYKFQIMYLRFEKYWLSPKLSTEMIELLEFFLPLYCLGNLIFAYFISYSDESSLSWYSILGIVLGLVHTVIPAHEINEYLFPIEDDANDETYNHCIQNRKILHLYEKSNPVTKNDKFLQKFEIQHQDTYRNMNL